MKHWIHIMMLVIYLTGAAMPIFAKPNKQNVTFHVPIHCQACIDKIYKTIAYEKGVRDLKCDLGTQTVIVTYDSTKTDIPKLQKAFENIKKPATVVPTEETKGL